MHLQMSCSRTAAAAARVVWPERNCGEHARTFGMITGDEGHKQWLNILMAPTGDMCAICHTTAPD